MSLVNNMLRDLEQRQDSSAPQVASVATGYGNNRQPFSSGAKLALGIGGTLMVCAAGLWAWQTLPIPADTLTPASIDDAPQPATIVAAAQAAAPQIVEPVSQTMAVAATNQQPAIETILSQAEPQPVALIAPQPNQANELRRLLAAAELAFKKDRLTTPINDNAYDHYRAALKIRADHPEALFGIEQIRQRYQQWAIAAHQQGDSTQALAQLERALFVSPQSTELLALQQQFREAQQPPAAQPPSKEHQQITPQRVADSADTVAFTAPTSTVTTSSQTLDQHALTTANQLLQNGEQQRALNLLREHIATYPAARQSTERLAELYLQTGDAPALEQLLQRTPALAQAKIIELQARLQLQQNNLLAASTLLEQQPPAVIDHPGYHSLLAGIYQKSGKYQQAASIYSKLVAIEPNTYRHWLGLAVALDALKDRPAALRAFQRARTGALNTPNRNPQVSSYIDQRIAALSKG